MLARRHTGALILSCIIGASCSSQKELLPTDHVACVAAFQDLLAQTEGTKLAKDSRAMKLEALEARVMRKALRTSDSASLNIAIVHDRAALHQDSKLAFKLAMQCTGMELGEELDDNRI